MANDELRERARAFDEPHDDKKYFQEWECFHYSNDAVYALMADFAARETAKLREQLDAAVRERDAWRLALESFTPNGSEFVNDLEACRSWVEGKFKSSMETIRLLHREKRELRAELERYRNEWAALRQAALAAAYPAASPWVPCSERLPEDVGTYLVTYNYGDGVNEDLVDVASFYESRETGTKRFRNHGFVIAWMPLPEPYKQEDTDGK